MSYDAKIEDALLVYQSNTVAMREIHVSVLTGNATKKIKYKFTQNSVVYDIKQAYIDEVNNDKDISGISLKYQGKTLKDNKTFISYNITKSCTIILTNKVHGGADDQKYSNNEVDDNDNDDNDVPMEDKQGNTGNVVLQLIGNVGRAVGLMDAKPISPKKKRAKQNKKGGNTNKDVNADFNKFGDPLGLIRLNNLGNTCFLNSAIQCAIQTPKFTDFLLYASPKTKTQPLTFEWTQFVKNAFSINPNGTMQMFKRIKRQLTKLKPCIGSGRQEDAHVALLTLLNGLDAETCNVDPATFELRFSDPNKIPNTKMVEYIIKNKIWIPHVGIKNDNNNDNDNKTDGIIRKLFDGVECEKLQCIECDFNQWTYQTYRDINLPLVNNLITLKLTVYIENQHNITIAPCEMEFNLSNNNSITSLKILIIQKLNYMFNDNNSYSAPEIDDIKMGYIKPSSNKQVNKWVTYLNDDTNCKQIAKSKNGFAIILPEVTDQKNDDKRSWDHCIPQYIVVLNEKGKQIFDQSIKDFKFIPFFKNNTTIPAKNMIKYARGSLSLQHSDIYKICVFYNDEIVLPDRLIEVQEQGAILIIAYQPNPKYNFDIDTINSFKIDPNDLPVIMQAKPSNLSLHAIANSLNSYLKSMQDQLSFMKRLKAQFMYTKNMTKDVECLKSIQDVTNKYMTLSIQIEQVEQAALTTLREKWKIISKNKTKQHTEGVICTDVSQCLKLYQTSDVSDCHALDCDVCGQSLLIRREIQILKTPQILLLHIDRDDNNEKPLHQYYYSNKTQHLIKYPLKNLDFKNDKYNLFAVCIHHGGSTKHGHYTAMVKSLHNTKWYLMNDDFQPQRISNYNTIVSENATILMYAKQIKQ